MIRSQKGLGLISILLTVVLIAILLVLFGKDLGGAGKVSGESYPKAMLDRAKNAVDRSDARVNG